jgi:tRNA threonylcarbamoyl adenosine modification protein (Sua5/YciO/YrdC/YwlC family)
MELYDCRHAAARAEGVAAAAKAVAAGGLVVLPTDTVYGVGGDAFDPAAVAALLLAKGRGRNLPPPVLVADAGALAELAPAAPASAYRLAERFWPGGLTVIVPHAPGLTWDLGDTDGTVGVRMPSHPVALELLRATGPLATSSANRHGLPPAATAAAARDQLGGSVEVYLEAGAPDPGGGGVPSAIVSVVGPVPRLVRPGAVGVAELREVLPDLVVPGSGE